MKNEVARKLCKKSQENAIQSGQLARQGVIEHQNTELNGKIDSAAMNKGTYTPNNKLIKSGPQRSPVL